MMLLYDYSTRLLAHTFSHVFQGTFHFSPASLDLYYRTTSTSWTWLLGQWYHYTYF